MSSEHVGLRHLACAALVGLGIATAMPADADGPAKLAVTITSPAPNAVVGSAILATYTSTNAAASLECGLDGALLPCAASGTSFNGLADGSSHTFTVRAVNAAGQTSKTASVSFVVDGAAPVVTAIKPNKPALGGAMTCSIALQDRSTIADVFARVDGGAFQRIGNGPNTVFNVGTLSPGKHVVEAYGVDVAGNTGAPAAPAAVPAPHATLTFAL